MDEDEAVLPPEVEKWLDQGRLALAHNEVGRDPTLDPALANHIARRGSTQNVFRAGTVQPIVLDELSRSPDVRDRQHVGVAPNAPEGAIRRLANDPDPEVRMWVAENWNAPLDVLDALAEDEDPDVRSSVELTCGGLLSRGGQPLEGDELAAARKAAERNTHNPDYWDS